MADSFVLEADDAENPSADFGVNAGEVLDTLSYGDLLAGSEGGVLGVVEENGNTTVTFTTHSGMVDLVTLVGVTGATLNTLLGASSEQPS